MRQNIRCSACNLMKITGRAAINGNNSHFAGSRGKCICTHPEAETSFGFLCSDSGRMPGFISFTVRGSDTPELKTSPKWCPRRLIVEPTKISKAEAYRITDTRKPLGLFFLKEGSGYTGIDNRTGDVWVEEFPTKTACLGWLTREGNENDSKRDGSGSPYCPEVDPE